MITNQAYIFMIFILIGIIIGVIFDFFRVLRKTIKTKDIITYIEDIIFCLLTGIILLYSIFNFNNGEIRIYMFIALILGIITYILTISKYFIKINVFILKKIIFVLKKILEIIKIHIRFLDKIIHKIFKPISFIIINLRRNLSKIYFIPNKLKKKPKKL